MMLNRQNYLQLLNSSNKIKNLSQNLSIQSKLFGFRVSSITLLYKQESIESLSLPITHFIKVWEIYSEMKEYMLLLSQLESQTGSLLATCLKNQREIVEFTDLSGQWDTNSNPNKQLPLVNFDLECSELYPGMP